MKSKPQMKKSEIFEEIIGKYVENPQTRGYHPELGGCYYYRPGVKNRCAIGSILKDEYLKPSETCNGGVSELCDHLGQEIDTIVDFRYTGHTLIFWNYMQVFHDGSELGLPRQPWHGNDIPKKHGRVYGHHDWDVDNIKETYEKELTLIKEWEKRTGR